MKALILKITVALIITFIYGCDFASGSYPYAERIEIPMTEQEFIDKVIKFKEKFQGYEVPEKVNIKDGKSDSQYDLWYHIYFYYQDENKIVYTWVRNSITKRNVSTFALVSINDGLILGNWKRINRDFSDKENEKEIKKFKDRILNRILEMK